jgi:hypothetical protein
VFAADLGKFGRHAVVRKKCRESQRGVHVRLGCSRRQVARSAMAAETRYVRRERRFAIIRRAGRELTGHFENSRTRIGMSQFYALEAVKSRLKPVRRSD